MRRPPIKCVHNLNQRPPSPTQRSASPSVCSDHGSPQRSDLGSPERFTDTPLCIPDSPSTGVRPWSPTPFAGYALPHSVPTVDVWLASADEAGDAMVTEDTADAMEIDEGAQGAPVDGAAGPPEDPDDPAEGGEGDYRSINHYIDECHRELTLMGTFPWGSRDTKRVFQVLAAFKNATLLPTPKPCVFD